MFLFYQVNKNQSTYKNSKTRLGLKERTECQVVNKSSVFLSSVPYDFLGLKCLLVCWFVYCFILGLSIVKHPNFQSILRPMHTFIKGLPHFMCYGRG